MKKQIKEVFNQLSYAYENSVDTSSLYNNEYERPAMLEQVPDNLTNCKVLDAGCAAGWYTMQLVHRGADVVAIDLSPEMVRATKRRVGDRAEVQCLDLEGELPFKDESFDFIISSLTLHYIKDWSTTFHEFKRILKPNGIFLFSVHHPFTDIKLLQEPSYFTTERIVDEWNKEGKRFEIPFYRRPLQSILNKTLRYFSIDEIIEPMPTQNFKKHAPEKYKQLLKGPQFVIIKAIK